MLSSTTCIQIILKSWIPPKYLRGLVYAALGVSTEIIFTGLRHWPSLEGKTQLWVIPLYYGGSVFLMEPFHNRWRHILTIYRLVVYAISIILIEYTAGQILKRYLGFCPWEYRNRRFAISGCANLAYAPLWALVGYAAEQVHDVLINSDTSCDVM